MERVAQWVVWHSHWVFGTQVTQVMPDNYPIRHCSPQNVALQSADKPCEDEPIQWENEPDSDVDGASIQDVSSDSSGETTSTSETSLGDNALD